MIRIGIVDDEREAAEALQGLIARCAQETGTEIGITLYTDAVAFLSNYQAAHDIVFMDIEMPQMDGMEAAQRLREMDRTTVLIFVTNLGHMAAMGYSVEAFDFAVKPISYPVLREKLQRAIRKAERNRVSNISFLSEGAHLTMPAAEIRYLEVRDHQLLFHTETGDYPVYGTMARMREQLEPLGFFLCNKCYLVNLRYVRRVEKFQVTVGADVLQISRPRKKPFLQALNNYIGG